jgi:hypothetical protein
LGKGKIIDGKIMGRIANGIKERGIQPRYTIGGFGVR